MSMWADEPWMVHGDGGELELADELAALLAGEPSGLSCDALARRLVRRRGDVREALRWDSRFERTGKTCGSRWRLAAEKALEDARGGLGRNDRGSPDPEPIPGVSVS